MKFTTTPLAACRIGDIDALHCKEFPVRAIGTPKVLVNGIPWSCFSHINHPHKGIPCGIGCCQHVAPIAVGSKKVFVMGLGAGRVGDYVATCTFVSTGSVNVFAGG